MNFQQSMSHSHFRIQFLWHVSREKGRRARSDLLNELQDGTLIDIGGVVLLFKNTQMTHNTPPFRIMEELNALNVQCPVLMHTIQFQHAHSGEASQCNGKRTRDYAASMGGFRKESRINDDRSPPPPSKPALLPWRLF